MLELCFKAKYLQFNNIHFLFPLKVKEERMYLGVAVFCLDHNKWGLNRPEFKVRDIKESNCSRVKKST